MSLTIYKSSAGSGKTHTLVLEYLKITLKNPDKYRRVLAITFTNKAAGEMKSRIITTLKDFASGNQNNKMALPLQEALKLSEKQLAENATLLLTNIIHHFEDFGVSTIDSFVHRIIRTFATDVKLPQDFEVVIDDDDIIPDIIEDLYNKLGVDKSLTDIMVEFVLSLTDDEKSYNPEQSLVEFIKQQTNEDGFEEIKKLSKLDLKRFLEILKLISSKLTKLQIAINTAATDALNLIKANDLKPGIFQGGKNGIASYFLKNRNRITEKTITPLKTVLKTIDEDKLFGSKATESDKAAISQIKGSLLAYYNTIYNSGRKFSLLKMVYTKLYAVALIKEIKDLFDDFTLRTNKVHISEFNKKISESIAGQPTPFIYERLGNKYEHFLIDEFQDTSILQWYNLLPLIENSLAAGNFNMLVGDAKQAIYRFRSGEVELFSNLPKLYGKPDLPYKTERENLLKQASVEKYLNNNFRSYKEIVDFNNQFFSMVIDENDLLIQDIYNQHEQEVVPEKQSGGYVSIELIESENTEDYQSKRLDSIQKYIEELLSRGFRYSDICVLSRRGNDATEVAAHLLTNNISVVSSESLLLTGSPEVRAVVAIFKGVLQPDNRVVLAEIVENILIIKKQTDKFNELTIRFFTNTDTAFNQILQWAGIKTDIELLKQKPVYQLAETLYNSITTDETPNIYFQYFLDFIIEKETVFGNRLDSFLELWNQKKEKLFIVMPEGEDAVQIMTIHKAKGLKFQVVIVDYQQRGNKNTKTEFWTDLSISEAPDLTTTLLPINKEKLTAIGKQEVYNHEKEKTQLDFLNLIYVAFTRPVEALFLIGEAPHKNLREEFSKTLVTYLKSSQQFDEEKLRYEYGVLEKLEDVNAITRDHLELSKWESNGGNFPIMVAPAEEVYWEMAGGNSQRIKGKMIHEILAHIRTVKDIEKAVNLYHTKGVIDYSERQQLTKEIKAVVNNTKLKTYYSDSVLVKNESDILMSDGAILRPDRVVVNDSEVTVIDYKTGKKEKKHVSQVLQYKQTFLSLGYKKVEGILIYISENIEIVKV